MSVLNVTWLDLLHELCLQNGYQLLLTAREEPGGFAEKPQLVLNHLDVVEPVPPRSAFLPRARMRGRLTAGDLIVRCDLERVDGDLDAAAELCVGLLERTRKAA